MEFVSELGMFFLKALVVVGSILIVISGSIASGVKSKGEKGELVMTNLTEKLKDLTIDLKRDILSKKAFKDYEKSLKKEEKSDKKSQEEKSNTFFIQFKGGVEASEVASLREEITAVLSIATPKDEIIVSVESGGGMVHGYGLAASQLARIRQAKIPLTICVDKVAASGGYMMACVADKIVAAPFAIVGSIGVIAQIPNFNKVLKKYDVDFEQHTAGEYKRTLTMFGQNTDEARDKFKLELEQTHQLFKEFVAQYRNQLDLDEVATGEHWFGQQALNLNLVDALQTSDDLLMQRSQNNQVFRIQYKPKKGWQKKLAQAASMSFEQVLQKLSTRKFYS